MGNVNLFTFPIFLLIFDDCPDEKDFACKIFETVSRCFIYYPIIRLAAHGDPIPLIVIPVLSFDA